MTKVITMKVCEERYNIWYTQDVSSLHILVLVLILGTKHLILGSHLSDENLLTLKCCNIEKM